MGGGDSLQCVPIHGMQVCWAILSLLSRFQTRLFDRRKGGHLVLNRELVDAWILCRAKA
jgi:hypothetical protein